MKILERRKLRSTVRVSRYDLSLVILGGAADQRHLNEVVKRLEKRVWER